MAHFAKIENGIVTNVVVVDNEHESYGEQYLNDLGIDGTWIQTSYSASIRKNFAGIGYSYNENLDAFVPPKPFASWILDEETCKWYAPSNAPDDDYAYAWDEDSTSWIKLV